MCVGVLSVALHSNELLFNLQSNHKLHNSRFKHSNNQSASERAFRHSSRNGKLQPRNPSKSHPKTPRKTPWKTQQPTLFRRSTYISRHCHLHVQLSAFCRRSFKCSARSFAIFRLLSYCFSYFCFFFFFAKLKIYLFMRFAAISERQSVIKIPVCIPALGTIMFNILALIFALYRKPRHNGPTKD